MDQEIWEIFLVNTAGASFIIEKYTNLLEKGEIEYQGNWECVNYSLPNSN